MKNKKFVFALLVVLLGSLYSNAQSSLEKKLKADLAQSKKHRETTLLKAQEQQKQNQKRGEMNRSISQQMSPNANSNAEMKQQANQNNSQGGKVQTKTPIRKEDINQ